jgi:hypothetical protein
VSPAERRERGTLLCRRLTEEVGAVVPEGIGRWSRTWELVAGADADFMLALTRWEATGDDSDKPALRAAYFAVLAAWRQATREYERERAER